MYFQSKNATPCATLRLYNTCRRTKISRINTCTRGTRILFYCCNFVCTYTGKYTIVVFSQYCDRTVTQYTQQIQLRRTVQNLHGTRPHAQVLYDVSPRSLEHNKKREVENKNIDMTMGNKSFIHQQSLLLLCFRSIVFVLEHSLLVLVVAQDANLDVLLLLYPV